jgi:hypothetical protein
MRPASGKLGQSSAIKPNMWPGRYVVLSIRIRSDIEKSVALAAQETLETIQCPANGFTFP